MAAAAFELELELEVELELPKINRKEVTNDAGWTNVFFAKQENGLGRGL
ncbi:hypothetical protein [Paenibacillus plantarum]|nr:hypothetical protein [Paenibacillus plantarum]